MADEPRQDDLSGPDKRMRVLGMLSTLPQWAWGVAGLLAIAPAVGFYLLLTRAVPDPRPSFIFFYWIGALYVTMRRSTELAQIFKRIGVMLGLECFLYLVISLFL